jgi:hypothetical protein
MVEDGSLKVLRILSHASAVIAEGEVDQLTAQRRIETDEEQYLTIISAKTAALFAAACRVAPVVAEANEDVELALESYGKHLGIAFQLTDDVIDYASDSATMGKGVGDDFRDGKMTLPVILAYARGSDEDRAFWRAAIGGERVSDEDLAHAVTLLRATEALADTIEQARHYGRRAIDAIANFPASKAKAALTDAVEFAIARAFCDGDAISGRDTSQLRGLICHPVFASWSTDDRCPHPRARPPHDPVGQGSYWALAARVRAPAGAPSGPADWVEWLGRHQHPGAAWISEQGSGDRLLRQARPQLPCRPGAAGSPQAPGLRRQFPLR